MKSMVVGTMAPLFLFLAITGGAAPDNLVPPSKVPSIRIGAYPQEVAEKFGEGTDLGGVAAVDVAVSPDGSRAYAATAQGLAEYAGGAWSWIAESKGQRIGKVALDGKRVWFTSQGRLMSVENGKVEEAGPLPEGGEPQSLALSPKAGAVAVATTKGVFQLSKGNSEFEKSGNLENGIHDIAFGPGGELAVAAEEGLFLLNGGQWERVDPKNEGEWWSLNEVRGVDFDSSGRLWFASRRGVGCLDKTWKLYTPEDGLPYNDFTTVAAGDNGDVWFGTTIGAIHFDGQTWEYRQGKRWLPGDKVNGISMDSKGTAWFATDGGVGILRSVPMTLAEKAQHYEDLIDKYNRRTEFGYVLEARVEKPGDLTSKVSNHDSDNDGLWTAMYGAGECFAYGATKDSKAKERAKNAFEALRYLSVAPISGSVVQQPGFVARTVIPVEEGDPNEQPSYSIEAMKRHRDERDSLWKVYFPRWPKSGDGKYYYKSDTSSDELDGHYFFYPLYYDLVAETDEERERVREVVRNLTDHLVRNNFCLVDHDGTPTRWSDYSPENLNHNHLWYNERGLKSLSMLSYLEVAKHVTGDAKYGETAAMLRRDHAYDTNAMVTKIQRGIGSGNQSDDEMAIMCYYNLIKYTDDAKLREEMTYSFFKYWILEFPELNPFFNFAYAACGLGVQYTNPWGTHDISPWEGWLEDSVDTLKRFPLDRFDWRHENSHRLDIDALPRQAAFEPYEAVEGRRWRRGIGVRKNGKVLPVDERHFEHYNHNPFALNYGGNGNGLADGAVYLLPYYMGLYHGFIVEE